MGRTTIELQISGLRDAKLAIERYGADVQRELRQALTDAGNFAVSTIAAGAPVGKTGLLSRTILGRQSQAGLLFTVTASRPYAYPVELGHGGPSPAPPHPFFIKPMQSARTQFYVAAKRALARAIPELGPGVVDVQET